jgi:hypothetical protein
MIAEEIHPLTKNDFEMMLLKVTRKLDDHAGEVAPDVY